MKEVLPKELLPDTTDSLVELVRRATFLLLCSIALTGSLAQLVRTDCNQFGLWSANDELLGVTVHPAASFFNHSCLPNCYCEWRGVNLVFKTLYPVPADNELVISYIAGNEPTKKRRKELKRVYHFECVCTRCVKMDGGAPPVAYDAFFFRYLQCPKCTGILKLDRKRKKPLNSSSSSEPSDPDPKENRSCMMCSRQRHQTDVVPSVSDYLRRFSLETDLLYVPQKGEAQPRKMVPVVDPDGPTPEESAKRKGRKKRRKEKQEREAQAAR